jgi:hypothetical protein
VLPIPELNPVAHAVIAVLGLHDQRPLVSLLDNARVIGQNVNAVVVYFRKVALIE